MSSPNTTSTPANLTTPPEPPDLNPLMVIDPPPKSAPFVEIVKGSIPSPSQLGPLPIESFVDENICDMSDVIHLSQYDKRQLYAPWKFSIIIKLVGKKLNHIYLKKKLANLWKLQTDFSLIDLGFEFFTVKFTDEESQRKIIHEGPWFVAGAYLAVRIWEPNSVPKNSQIISTAI